MNMKIVTELTGAALEGSLEQSGGVLQQVLDEPAKGYFRSTKLSREALVIKRGKIAVGIPLEVLWRLAEQIEPKLIPGTPAVISEQLSEDSEPKV